jgi:phosphate transport system permease protein
MAPAIVGTLLITATASAIAIPLGILGAVYLNEYGKNGALARTIRFLANVMTGVPSIVMGLFIYVLFTLRFGLSGLGGALALACLMLPVVIRSSEEMLRLVPDNLREASYALGTRKSRTILGIVLPTALPAWSPRPARTCSRAPTRRSRHRSSATSSPANRARPSVPGAQPSPWSL